MLDAIPRRPSFRGTFKADTAAAIARDLRGGDHRSLVKQLDLNGR